MISANRRCHKYARFFAPLRRVGPYSGLGSYCNGRSSSSAAYASSADSLFRSLSRNIVAARRCILSTHADPQSAALLANGTESYALHVCGQVSQKCEYQALG